MKIVKVARLNNGKITKIPMSLYRQDITPEIIMIAIFAKLLSFPLEASKFLVPEQQLIKNPGKLPRNKLPIAIPKICIVCKNKQVCFFLGRPASIINIDEMSIIAFPINIFCTI
jgi:hypothetical protein